MRKIYIKPATEVYNVTLSNSIVTGSPDENFTTNPSSDDVGDGGDYARENNNDDNNRGSIWDNVW